jgi:hypothetical protein
LGLLLRRSDEQLDLFVLVQVADDLAELVGEDQVVQLVASRLGEDCGEGHSVVFEEDLRLVVHGDVEDPIVDLHQLVLRVAVVESLGLRLVVDAEEDASGVPCRDASYGLVVVHEADHVGAAVVASVFRVAELLSDESDGDLRIHVAVLLEDVQQTVSLADLHVVLRVVVLLEHEALRGDPDVCGVGVEDGEVLDVGDCSELFEEPLPVSVFGYLDLLRAVVFFVLHSRDLQLRLADPVEDVVLEAARVFADSHDCVVAFRSVFVGVEHSDEDLVDGDELEAGAVDGDGCLEFEERLGVEVVGDVLSVVEEASFDSVRQDVRSLLPVLQSVGDVAHHDRGEAAEVVVLRCAFEQYREVDEEPAGDGLRHSLQLEVLVLEEVVDAVESFAFEVHLVVGVVEDLVSEFVPLRGCESDRECPGRCLFASLFGC